VATDLDIDVVRKLIETRLHEGWTHTPVAWPGVDHEPAPDLGNEAWIRPTILWGDGFPRTIDRTNEVVGLLRVQLFDRPGSGYKLLYERADLLRALFDAVNVTDADTGTEVELGAASGMKPATETVNGWLQGVVDVPFRVFEVVTG
jgi:hypothetical protein